MYLQISHIMFRWRHVWEFINLLESLPPISVSLPKASFKTIYYEF